MLCIFPSVALLPDFMQGAIRPAGATSASGASRVTSESVTTALEQRLKVKEARAISVSACCLDSFTVRTLLCWPLLAVLGYRDTPSSCIPVDSARLLSTRGPVHREPHRPDSLLFQHCQRDSRRRTTLLSEVTEGKLHPVRKLTPSALRAAHTSTSICLCCHCIACRRSQVYGG